LPEHFAADHREAARRGRPEEDAVSEQGAPETYEPPVLVETGEFSEGAASRDNEMR